MMLVDTFYTLCLNKGMKLALTHGKIYQEAHQFVEALLIEDGWITVCGRNDHILSLIDSNTEHIHLGGRTVLPGFNDSHLHFYNTARVLEWANLRDLPSIETMLSTLNNYLKAHQGTVVYGMGWNQELFIEDAKRYPTRYDLDQLDTHKPIVLYRMDAHVVVCNTKALELMFDVLNPPLIEGGVIELDEHRQVTGLLRENALTLLERLPEDQDASLIDKRLDTMIQLAHQQGITSVQINDLHLSRDINPLETAYLKYAQNKPTIRITHQICFKSLDDFKARIAEGYFVSNDAYLRYGPLKLFADGTLGARTAALHEPYHDDLNERGLLTLTFEELKAWIQTAHDNNIQVVVHTIGDRAMDTVMDVYESLHDPDNTNRHGMIHLQISNDALLARVAKLNLLALVQPIFLHQDMHVLIQRVGQERASRSYAFKTLKDLGCVVAYSSDAPIESFNVFENLHCAVLRQDLNDEPKDGFFHEERVSLSDAIDAMSILGAYVSFEESYKGRLKEGYVADLIVLDRDIFERPLSQLKQTQVDMTFVSGEMVYKKGS